VSSSNTFGRAIAAGISLGSAHAKRDFSRVQNPARELDDERAMCLVQKGDKEALGLLFDRYANLILKIATRILRNPTEAQDVVQEVFLYVHRKNQVFNVARGPVASWLIQITYSRALNRRQRLTAAAETDCARIEELADLADMDVGPERFADALCARKLVEEGLAELTERQRETLRLYFFEGYSLREISATLKESFDNTRHHYYRGIARLKRLLRDFGARENGEGAA
jgi:RNA polymerase sigma-70 factor, ECF subfamily